MKCVGPSFLLVLAQFHHNFSADPELSSEDASLSGGLNGAVPIVDHSCKLITVSGHCFQKDNFSVCYDEV